LGAGPGREARLRGAALARPAARRPPPPPRCSAAALAASPPRAACSRGGAAASTLALHGPPPQVRRSAHANSAGATAENATVATARFWRSWVLKAERGITTKSPSSDHPSRCTCRRARRAGAGREGSAGGGGGGRGPGPRPGRARRRERGQAPRGALPWGPPPLATPHPPPHPTHPLRQVGVQLPGLQPQRLGRLALGQARERDRQRVRHEAARGVEEAGHCGGRAGRGAAAALGAGFSGPGPHRGSPRRQSHGACTQALPPPVPPRRAPPRAPRWPHPGSAGRASPWPAPRSPPAARSRGAPPAAPASTGAPRPGGGARAAGVVRVSTAPRLATDLRLARWSRLDGPSAPGPHQVPHLHALRHQVGAGLVVRRGHLHERLAGWGGGVGLGFGLGVDQDCEAPPAAAAAAKQDLVMHHPSLRAPALGPSPTRRPPFPDTPLPHEPTFMRILATVSGRAEAGCSA
jgi:hypothetical protein